MTDKEMSEEGTIEVVPNKANPIVKIILDKERTLRLDGNAIMRFEQRTGKSILKGITWADMTWTDIHVMLWSSLRGEDPTLKMDQVGAMYDFPDLEYISEKIQLLMTVSLPEKDEGTDPLATRQNG